MSEEEWLIHNACVQCMPWCNEACMQCMPWCNKAAVCAMYALVQRSIMRVCHVCLGATKQSSKSAIVIQ